MKKYALAFALTLTNTAFAASGVQTEFVTQGKLERSIEFSIGDSSIDVTAVSVLRDKLTALTKTQGDFNLGHRFSFEIDGVTVGGIHSIEGFEQETDVVEYKDGEAAPIHTRPGNPKPGKMTITKDWSNTSEWLKWRKAVLDGKVDRRSISVIFHNDAGEEVGRIQALGCLPVQLLVSESPFERDKAARQEVAVLECLSMTLKSRHDAAMAAIQNTR